MNHDSPPAQESRQSTEVMRLADAAEAFAKDLDLDRHPTLHVTKALQGIPEGRERNRLFGQIVAELKQRGFQTPQERKREERQMLSDAREQLMIEDAYKHQARIDPRERDDDEAA